MDLPDWDSFPQTLCTCSSASMHSHQTVQLIFSFLLLLVLESPISKGEKSRFFSLPFDLWLISCLQTIEVTNTFYLIILHQLMECGFKPSQFKVCMILPSCAADLSFREILKWSKNFRIFLNPLIFFLLLSPVKSLRFLLLSWSLNHKLGSKASRQIDACFRVFSILTFSPAGWQRTSYRASPTGTVLTALSLLQDDQGAPPAPGLGDEVHRGGSTIFCGPQLPYHHL